MSTLSRLHALDAIRGVCAVALMFYHYYMWNGTDHFQIGYFGVYMFFMLSGFSMWYVYASKPLDIGLLRHFFIARVARIFPLYAVVVVLGAAARVFAQGFETVNADFFHRYLVNTTLMFGLSQPGKTSFVPGGWSIGIEFVFYLVFPLFLLFGRSLKGMLALLVASFALNQCIALSLLSQSTMAEQWTNYTNFPTFLVYFVAGIVTAMGYGKLSHRPLLQHPVLCRVVPVAAIAVMFCYPSDTQEHFLQGAQVALLIAVGMAGIFFAALLKPSLWERRCFQFLGDISYSTYVLNFFVYQLVSAVLNRLYPDHGLSVTVALSASGSIILAYLSYRFYELPARIWLNAKLNGQTSR